MRTDICLLPRYGQQALPRVPKIVVHTHCTALLSKTWPGPAWKPALDLVPSPKLMSENSFKKARKMYVWYSDVFAHCRSKRD